MKVVRWDDVHPEPGGDEKFTGAVERRDLLEEPQQHAGMRLGWVRFDDGARTNWHKHDGEQLLYVIERVGCVGTDHATIQIGAGDVVRIPAGERHWHGAGSGRQLVHVAITGGVKSDWGKLPDRPAACDPTG
jgi:quercetin dioxygenase-like cupin family protein